MPSTCVPLPCSPVRLRVKSLILLPYRVVRTGSANPKSTDGGCLWPPLRRVVPYRSDLYREAVRYDGCCAPRGGGASASRGLLRGRPHTSVLFFVCCRNDTISYVSRAKQKAARSLGPPGLSFTT